MNDREMNMNQNEVFETQNWEIRLNKARVSEIQKMGKFLERISESPNESRQVNDSAREAAFALFRLLDTLEETG